jgi:Flp pilus assembly protein CpaB
VDIVLSYETDAKDESRRAIKSLRILRSVRVMAVGRRIEAFSSGTDTDASDGVDLTLEVTPEGAVRLASAQQLGTLTFALVPSIEAIADTEAEAGVEMIEIDILKNDFEEYIRLGRSGAEAVRDIQIVRGTRGAR